MTSNDGNGIIVINDWLRTSGVNGKKAAFEQSGISFSNGSVTEHLNFGDIS